MYGKKKTPKKWRGMWVHKGWRTQKGPRMPEGPPRPLRAPPADDPGRYGVRGLVKETHYFETFSRAMKFALHMTSIGRSVGGPGAHPDALGRYAVRVG